MAGKPRVVEVKDTPKKPRVVREEDYSRIIEGLADGGGQEQEAAKEPMLFKGLQEEKPLEEADAVRDELREQALKDITPLSNEEVMRKAEEERRKRGGIGGRAKRFLGLE